MANLVNAINKVVNDAIGAQTFCDIGFGTITSESPLTMEVQTDGGILELTYPDFIYVAQHITDYDIPFELNQRYLSNELTSIQKTTGFFAIHVGEQVVDVRDGYIGDYIGQGTIRLLNHLIVGDKVIYVRIQGGHKYIIMDRIGEV